MNLNQLYYFVTLAETEHYSRAAEMLSITQPSLSHAVAKLEEELETELFEKREGMLPLQNMGRCSWNTPRNPCNRWNSG